MICCTRNNCTSCHCGSACECEGHFYPKMSWDIGHKIYDLPLFVFTSSSWLSLLMTGGIQMTTTIFTHQLDFNIWSLSFSQELDIHTYIYSNVLLLSPYFFNNIIIILKLRLRVLDVLLIRANFTTEWQVGRDKNLLTPVHPTLCYQGTPVLHPPYSFGIDKI